MVDVKVIYLRCLSIAGEIDTGEGRTTLVGQYRVLACRIAGVGKYQAELAPEVAREEPIDAPAPSTADDADYYEIL